MLKKEEYLKTVRRSYTPLQWSMMFEGQSDPDNYKGMIEKRHALKHLMIVDHVAYYSRKEMDETGLLVLEDWKNPEQLREADRVLKKREKELLKAAEEDFESYYRAYENYCVALVIIFSPENPLNAMLRELLGSKVSEEEVDRIMDGLNMPERDNYYKQEEYDLVTCNDLKEHVKKYEWIKSRYGEDDPYTLEEARKKLSEIDKEEYIRKRKEEKEHLKQIKEEAKKILGKDAYLVDIMQFIVFYRTHRTDNLNRSSYLAMPMLKALAKEKNLTYKQLLYCTREEISNKIPSVETLKKRVEDYVVLLDEEGISCLSGEECRKIRDYMKEEVQDSNELKGQAAYKGKVTGAAKIILSRDDFGKIEEGDILITSMTTLEMIHLMKKAAAFVTDEGGITCHAAIVSRELGKPCVIGTGIATQVFKEGDQVEVDADRGVVRLLK